MPETENSKILYLSVLYFFANLLLLNIKKTYTKPENLGFCYQHISMPNNVLRTQSRFYGEVLSQK